MIFSNDASILATLLRTFIYLSINHIFLLRKEANYTKRSKLLVKKNFRQRKKRYTKKVTPSRKKYTRRKKILSTKKVKTHECNT